ncbi:hypothetical protein AOQ84DRAFT_413204 [Glonium stellatum]|uniref:Uncharacterized protein n=1 Tax=Glonium stellatum TaxID=574774 RepID=A0A8E2JQ94_9PEZI|nr:hypothetical protein AOQ84DRAFT_413204 [Glonium stellatum]
MNKKWRPATGGKDMTLFSRNAALADKTISLNSVRTQLSTAPAPTDKGKSGYPHEYRNLDNLIPMPKAANKAKSGYPHEYYGPKETPRERTTSTASSVDSTTNLYEYPVQQSGTGYNFDSKPKDDPGPFRAIANQNKKYKGTICHDGDKDTRNPNAGSFHLCHLEASNKDPGGSGQAGEEDYRQADEEYNREAGDESNGQASEEYYG